MQGPIRCVLVAGILIGCVGTPPVGPDPDEVDATVGSGGGGLVVEWSTPLESWPGPAGTGITLERAVFTFDSLRVVGDAGPGDPRTTATAFEVRWDEATQPESIMFAEAPSGRYSQVSVLLDGPLSNESYRLRGNAMVDGTEWEFVIEDDDPLAFNVQIDKTLTPPDIATVKLRINFQAALAVIDFSTLDIDNGRLDLEEGDAQMPAFRTALVTSFEITNNDAGGGAGAQ